MLELRARLQREGLALMDALGDAIKARFTRAECAELAAVLQASIGKGEMPKENACFLAAQVWDILPDALRERFLKYRQRVYEIEGETFADVLAALGAPTDVQKELDTSIR
jgi:hypothetical protein